MKIFSSATFSTWIFTFSKLLVLALLTYLIVSKFSEAEITLWYLFASIQGFGHLFDIGFSSTILRFTSYNNAETTTTREKTKDLQDLFGSMNLIYLLLAVIVFCFLGIVGKVTVMPIIEENSSILSGDSYLIILFLFPINFFFKKNDAFIKGFNKVSLYNNWNAGIYLITGLITAFFIYLGDGFFYIILINQIGILVITTKNYFLVKSILAEINLFNFKLNFEKIKYYWGPTWKSALISFSSNGANHLTSIIVSSHFPVNISSSFLFSMRMLNIVNEFSWAPFYSNLPYFITNYKLGLSEALKKKIIKRINISLSLFILGAFVLILIAPKALEIANSNTSFINNEIATYIMLMIIVERIIAMHSQVIMFTNNIEHYKYYFAGSIAFVSLLFFMIDDYGLYTIPFSYYFSFVVCLLLIVNRSLKVLEIRPIVYVGKYLSYLIILVIILMLILL